MIMSAYQNKVLRIDCTKQETRTEPLNMEFAEKYVGSKGLAIRYMYEDMKPGVDPLGPENNLYLTTGPMTGTPIPCSGKLSVAAKSPATGTMNDCSIGGHAGIRLKFAGYDMVVFEGQMDKPSYIVIEDDKITFHDAADLWGLTSHQAEKKLIEEYGTEYSVLSIGPAGENLNFISCINSDYYRQAGRGGIGAVMGSKKLKAILIKGTQGVKVPNIKETTDRILEIFHENCLSEDNEYVFDEGTYAFLEACNDGGILPAHNFSAATDVNWDKYNGAVMKKYRLGKRGCGSCGLGCGNFMKVGDAIVEGPEYETTAASGPQCDIVSIEHNVRYNQLVDDLGMDSISTGVTVAWAMEMAEKGIHDFGVHFGNEEEMLNYYAYKPTDCQGFGTDQEIYTEYNELFRSADDIIASVKILSEGNADSNEAVVVDRTPSSDLYKIAGTSLFSFECGTDWFVNNEIGGGIIAKKSEDAGTFDIPELMIFPVNFEETIGDEVVKIKNAYLDTYQNRIAKEPEILTYEMDNIMNTVVLM